MGKSRWISVGITILISRELILTILRHGIIEEGRAQFVIYRISYLESTIIGNVYNARNSKEKANTWRLFLEKTLEATHFILGGDFNNIKLVEKMGLIGLRFMLKKEMIVWH
jgi:hypothetical protein